MKRLVLGLLMLFSATPSLANFDSNWLYGYEGFLTKENHQKHINLQEIGMYFVVTRNLKIEGYTEDSEGLVPFELEEGSVFIVNDIEADWAKLGLIASGKGLTANPVTAWMPVRKLWKTRLTKVGTTMAYIDELMGQKVVIPDAIRDSELAEDRKYSRKKDRRVLHCYRWVKEYLLRRNLVTEYLPGESAKVAARYLKQHGYQQVMGPQSSPVGSICVYDGGWHQHGHVEVKRGARCWWYGYGCKEKPVQQRKLIGCFHKGWGASQFAYN